MSETETKTKHTFEVAVNYRPFLGKKLPQFIEEAVNSIDKHTDVCILNDFDDGHMFIVRAGKYYNELELEEEHDIVAHHGFVELFATDNVSKKVRFALWKRLKASEILR